MTELHCPWCGGTHLSFLSDDATYLFASEHGTSFFCVECGNPGKATFECRQDVQGIYFQVLPVIK
jgi:predicted RNA-binding Zn-ribbon protein involved in translation (DUF1610 family)